MIIIYSDKPYISRLIFKSLQEKFPSQQLVFIHCLYFTNVSFAYPKNIKFYQFPYIQDTEFKINPIERWIPLTPLGETLVHIDISMNDIVKAEKIIYASDPCYESTYPFSIFIEQLFDKKVSSMDIDSLLLYALSYKDIETSIKNIDNFYTRFEETLNYGKVVKYFDYNFNFNSFALLGKFFKCTQAIFNNEKNYSDENVFFSKYMIQLLYFINKDMLAGVEPKTESVLINNMHHWKGTGKYSIRANFGSSASRVTILENLKDLDLIYTEKSNSTKNKIYLTEEGKHFLSMLPKDCQDQDLPFRIKLWAEQPFEESKLKIDTYLNNYLKKIKNKINLLDIKS